MCFESVRKGKATGIVLFHEKAREAVGNTDLSLKLEYVNSIACGEFIRIESAGLQAHKESIKIMSGEAMVHRVSKAK
jgi:hypothetical protein